MIEKRLKISGYELPKLEKPSFRYKPVVVHNNLIFVSGQLPKVDGEVKTQGKVGDEVMMEQARESSRICILQALSCIKQEINDLNKICKIIKLTGYINSAKGFHEQPKVLDAGSELLEDLFGEKGRHSRVAIGVSELPRNAPIEIEMIASLD